jgi:hypothetical protein
MRILPTLDTGWLKSAWTLFWIGPFALFASTGLVLVATDVALNGFRQPWWNQAIGLTLLLAFTALLNWILFRGMSRERVWITDDIIRIQKNSLLSESQKEILISDLRCFELRAAAEVFDIFIRLSDGRSFPLVIALSTMRMEQWTQQLEGIAPVTTPSSTRKIQGRC